MAHEKPDLTSEVEKAAQKPNGVKATRFARRRAAAKKAAETRRSVAGMAPTQCLNLPNVGFKHCG